MSTDGIRETGPQSLQLMNVLFLIRQTILRILYIINIYRLKRDNVIKYI